MTLPVLNENLSFEITIPSTKKTVKARPYLTKEEKILLFAMESEDPNQMFEAMLQILGNCLEIDQKAIMEFTVFDVEYCFIKLRSISVGEISELQFQCSHCEAMNDISIDLNTVKVEERDTYTPLLDFGGGIHIEVGYPRVKDLKDSDQLTFDEEKQGLNAQEMFDFLRTVIRKVIMNDEQFIFSEYSEQEQNNFIERFSSNQLQQVLGFMNPEKIPATYTNIEFDCMECGAHNKREVKGVQNFFS